MDEYIEILREWERNVALPAVYEHIDVLFPKSQFRRVQAGSSKDHWASRYKMDGSLPKVRNYEKTVIYRSDMKFREQGDWNNAVSVVDAVMRRQGLSSVYDFDNFVAGTFGLDMPRTDSSEVRQAASKNMVRRRILEEMLDYFVWNLNYNAGPGAGKVRNYLKNVRNFTPDGIAFFRFGFVPTWEKVVNYITVRKKLPKEELDVVCQVYNDAGKTAVGKTHTLAIPYICGDVLKGFIFRRIDGNEPPKYIANAGLDRKSVFFNIAQTAEEIVVVEGEMDAITATAAGVAGAVAIGGSEVSGERRRQIEDAFRRGVRKITLCLDLDSMKDSPLAPNVEARHKHIMRTIHTIKDVEPDFDEIYIAAFTDPCDPDEYVKRHGSSELVQFISSSVPYWQYAYDYYSSGKR